jgi:uncharacterized DUF497 family protein
VIWTCAGKSYIRSLMLMTWDEAKRLANLAKHPNRFCPNRRRVFRGVHCHRREDGGYQAFGRHEGSTLAVIVAPLGEEAISTIRARIASKKERELLNG